MLLRGYMRLACRQGTSGRHRFVSPGGGGLQRTGRFYTISLLVAYKKFTFHAVPAIFLKKI